MTVRARFPPFHNILIERIFAHHPAQPDDRSDDPINNACLHRHFLNIPDGGLAQRTDFKLQAERRREGRGSQAAVPVRRGISKLDLAIAGIVCDLQKSRRAAFHGMVDVVHKKWIAVIPSVNIDYGVFVVPKEWTRQASSCVAFGRQPERLLEKQEPCGSNRESAPLDSLIVGRPDSSQRLRGRLCGSPNRFAGTFTGIVESHGFVATQDRFHS